MNSLEEHLQLQSGSSRKEQQDKTLFGTDDILDRAAKLGIITPDSKIVDQILTGGDLLHRQWLNHPETQKILLVLHVLMHEQRQIAEQQSDSTSADVRTPLIKSKTLERIITYVSHDKPSSITLPRL